MSRTAPTWHVITVHFQPGRWIQLQTNAICRWCEGPLKLWGTLEGIDPSWSSGFDQVVPAVGQHAGKLNLLATEVLKEAAPDGVLVFIDGDAFPVALMRPWLDELLSKQADPISERIGSQIVKDLQMLSKYGPSRWHVPGLLKRTGSLVSDIGQAAAG